MNELENKPRDGNKADVIETLIAISVVARKLADKLKGEDNDGKNERTVADAG